MHLKKLLLFLLPIFLFFIFNSCENSIEPHYIKYGVTGKIYDNEGNPLSGVKVYYTFNYNWNQPAIIAVPPYYPEIIFPKKISNAEEITEFKLYQNYPNPFANSTYLRFALPEECKIEINIYEGPGKNIYSYTETLTEGLYQKGLVDFAENNNLVNGIYECGFTARNSNNTLIFSDSILICLSGNSSLPNYISEISGYYQFNYDDANIGTVIYENLTDDGNFRENLITHTVYLFFEREGYIGQTAQLNLYDDLLLSNDIVMERGSNE